MIPIEKRVGTVEKVLGAKVKDFANDTKVYYYFNRQDEAIDTTDNHNNDTIQGECCIIKAYGKTIMIDSGGTNRRTTIKKYLADIGVSHVDYLIISHYHYDHCTNFSEGYFDDLDWAGCVAYLPLNKPLAGDDNTTYYNHTVTKCAQLGITAVYPNEGDLLIINSKFKIKFLNCGATAFSELDASTPTPTNLNTYGMLCMVYHDKVRVLYGADAMRNNQLRLFNKGLLESVNLYKHHHHGVNTTGTTLETGHSQEYFDAISPDYVISINSANTIYSASATTDLRSYLGYPKFYKTLSSNALFISQNNVFSNAYGQKHDIIGAVSSIRYLDASCSQILATGTDFDTIKTPGIYYVYGSGAGGTMLNIPSGYNGKLIVENTALSTTDLVQTYYDRTGPIWCRVYTDSAWKSWFNVGGNIISSWTPMTLTGGATAWNSGANRYRTRTEGGHTVVDVEINIQTISPTTTFFTFPVGLRVPYFTRKNISITAATWGMVELSTTGTMQIAATNGFDSTKYATGCFSFWCD